MHVLNIAEASLAEAGYCVHAAHRLGYIDDSLLSEIEKDISRVGAPLAGLVRSTKTDLTLSVFCFAVAIVVVSWLAV